MLTFTAVSAMVIGSACSAVGLGLKDAEVRRAGRNICLAAAALLVGVYCWGGA